MCRRKGLGLEVMGERGITEGEGGLILRDAAGLALCKDGPDDDALHVPNHFTLNNQQDTLDQQDALHWWNIHIRWDTLFEDIFIIDWHIHSLMTKIIVED